MNNPCKVNVKLNCMKVKSFFVLSSLSFSRTPHSGNSCANWYAQQLIFDVFAKLLIQLMWIDHRIWFTQFARRRKGRIHIYNMYVVWSGSGLIVHIFLVFRFCFLFCINKSIEAPERNSINRANRFTSFELHKHKHVIWRRNMHKNLAN